MLQNSCPHDLNTASRNHVGLFSHSVLFRVNNFTHSVWPPWNQGMAKEFNRAWTEDWVSTHAHFRTLPVRQGTRVRREARVGQEPWSPWVLLLWALRMPGVSLNFALFTVISTLLSAVPRPPPVQRPLKYPLPWLYFLHFTRLQKGNCPDTWSDSRIL